jgi:hypothetical protein
LSSATSNSTKDKGNFSLSAIVLNSEPFYKFLINAYVLMLFLARIRDVSRPIPADLPVTNATLGFDDTRVQQSQPSDKL